MNNEGMRLQHIHSVLDSAQCWLISAGGLERLRDALEKFRQAHLWLSD